MKWKAWGWRVAVIVALSTGGWQLYRLGQQSVFVQPALTPISDIPSVPGNEGAAAQIPPPPFFVRGTFVSPEIRTAQVSVHDKDNKVVASYSVKEGDTLEGYLVKGIYNHLVYFERDKAVFVIAVGSSRIEAPSMLPADAFRGNFPQKERTIEFVPPPENIEEVRKQAEAFVDRLRQDPEFQKVLEKKKKEIMEQQMRQGAGTGVQR